jgi:hypothetical protein
MRPSAAQAIAVASYLAEGSMSASQEIAASGDDMIRILATREDGIVHYGIGQKITVTWRGGDRYLCHTCVKVDCAHVERVRRYRDEHPAGSGT